jgi:hypothetical protein
MLINIVPIDRARSIYKTSLLQKYFQSLDMISNDLQVRIPTLAASLALPLLFKYGPSCITTCRRNKRGLTDVKPCFCSDMYMQQLFF